MQQKFDHTMPLKNLKKEDLSFAQAKKTEDLITKNLEQIADVGAEEREEKLNDLINLDEDGIVQLLEGKKFGSIKLQKHQRRELKYLVKASPPWEKVLEMLKE